MHGCQQDCKNNQPISLKLGTVIVPINGKTLLTFGDDPISDKDSGSRFHTPKHCRSLSRALLVASRYVCLATMIGEPGFEAQAGRIIVSVIAAYALRLNSLAGTEGSTVSSLICDGWLMLGSETLSISRCLNH